MKVVWDKGVIATIVASGVVLAASVAFETAIENLGTWITGLSWIAKWLAFGVLVSAATKLYMKQKGQAASALSLSASTHYDPLAPAFYFNWTIPKGASEVSLMLDVKPVGQPVSRKRILTKHIVDEGETLKIELFSYRNDAWRWATAAGEIMHKDAMTCRLVAFSNGEIIGTWRLSIPERQFKDKPPVVGETLFNAPLD